MFRFTRSKSPPILIPPRGQQPASHGRRRRKQPHRGARRLVRRAAWVVSGALAVLALAFVARVAWRRLRTPLGGYTVTTPPREATRLVHPCLPDAVTRRVVAAATGQPSAVAVVEATNDAGLRRYVGDTVRGMCLALRERGTTGEWIEYRMDASGSFVAPGAR